MQTKTLSASLVGSASFVAKFGQSLAPILAYSMLPDLRSGLLAPSASMQASIWRLLLGIPFICVVIQLSLWLLTYQLHGQYLKRIKHDLSVADK
jgi:Na+/melibiose symporter-like transporter